MINVSKIYNTPPKEFKSKLHKKVYEVFENLSINYERVDTDEAITMQDCVEIEKTLNVEIVKTLFLCNRQKTRFYLFITNGNKKFDCKKFGSELNISRVSFADEETMISMLDTKIGSATILSSLIDDENKVDIVIDKDIMNSEYYGCSDSTTTGYIKIRMADIFDKILPYSKHIPKVIEM